MNSCPGKAWRSSGNRIITVLLGNGNMDVKRRLVLPVAFNVEMYVITL